jgi:CMP-N-acetylneuraminic acid synthetase
VVVSTDDPEIKSVALAEGAQVDDRPPHMAGDTVTKVEVVREYLERTKASNHYDMVAALLPTCPFRTAQHIKEAFGIFKRNTDLPFLIGVTAYEFPIQLALTETGTNRVKITFADGYATTRSQNIETRYHPNGAMYFALIESFLRKGTFFNQEMQVYKMSAVRSFDIDYPYQFEIAEILAQHIHLYE